MSTLKILIEEAANIAYEQDADQVVGLVEGEWITAHIEDNSRQAEMRYPIRVHSYGVDQGHIHRGEVTEEWDLVPEAWEPASARKAAGEKS